VNPDQDHDDELIPQTCRDLYECLIAEGSRPLDTYELESNSAIRSALLAGLVEATPRNNLSAVRPSAALERVIMRWLDRTDKTRRLILSAYEQAASLQHRLIRMRSGERTEGCEVLGSASVVSAALRRAAEYRICDWSTGPYGLKVPSQRLSAKPEADISLAWYLPADSKLLSRGGSYLSVWDEELATQRREMVDRATVDGEKIRIRQKKLPMKLIIIDDHSALVPLGPFGSPALLIRAKPLVALFQRFFDLVWDTATPYEPNAKRSATQPKVAHHKLLELMATGMKDEAIARQCDVSVKTVRRHIAKIMNELGARNRFAAGVAAVRLGLI
jgi:DNA-binding CsgD family transcriptional regulator